MEHFSNPTRTPNATMLAGITTALLVGANVCWGQDGPSLRDAFLNSAPAAWKEYREWATRLQGSYTCKSLYEHRARRR